MSIARVIEQERTDFLATFGIACKANPVEGERIDNRQGGCRWTPNLVLLQP